MDLLALAKNTADRVEAEASRAKVPVAVCVIDAHGNVILKHRMNGAQDLLDRTLRAEGLYIGAGGCANSRTFAARAARAATVPADVPG